MWYSNEKRVTPASTDRSSLRNHSVRFGARRRPLVLPNLFHDVILHLLETSLFAGIASTTFRMSEQGTEISEVVDTRWTPILIAVIPIVSVVSVLETFKSPCVKHVTRNTRWTYFVLQMIEYRRLRRKCPGTSVALFRSWEVHLGMLRHLLVCHRRSRYMINIPCASCCYSETLLHTPDTDDALRHGARYSRRRGADNHCNSREH